MTQHLAGEAHQIDGIAPITVADHAVGLEGAQHLADGGVAG